MPHNLSNNTITSNAGADTISAAGRDDRIYVQDGSGDDLVNCGEDVFGSDDDTVHYDSGDQIAENCENSIGQP